MCPTLIKHNGKIVEKYNKNLLDHTKREYWVKQGYTFESGWQACNLSTINVSNLDSVEEFNHVSRHAGILGTIQASYSKTNYLGKVSQQIIERESLLGVSLCGILDKPEITLNGIHLRNASREVKKANEEYAEKIGIPKASRTTCVKPEGTSSIVLNSSSGIHPHHSKKYIRRVNANLDEPIFQKFNSQNPHAVEDSVWGADKVISFALEAPKNAMVKSDLDAISFMRIAKLVYLNWVVGGNQVKRLEKANHNVSITVSVEKHEWDKVKDFLWEEKDHFCGVSFLSSSGDYDYQQAPFQRIYEPGQQTTEEHKRMWEYWNLLKEKTKYVDYDNLFEEIDTTKPMEQIACGNGACQII
jgi:ribonucleoside-diphosphate reductase alpha chain